MARETHDREDLLRDATALIPRVILRLPINGTPSDVFAGFRKNDAVSLYFDSDPVYQFNTQMELRRAFVDGRIVKAERGHLYLWEQERSTQEVGMVSRPLTRDEQTQFGEQLLARIGQLRDRVQNEQFELVGQVPVDADAVSRLKTWLQGFSGLVVARAAGLR